MNTCYKKRWGQGTTCERPVNTEVSKEFKEKLALLEAERAKQDKMWTQSSCEADNKNSNNTSSIINKT